jgi:CPA2 family monovalent cation:H+ antiporter-2
VPEIDLLLTLAASLSIAVVLGYLAHRVGLSPIAGYLLAGVAVGPFTPGFVADAGLAEQLADVGVILLMFGVGLQFKLDELLAVQRVAIPGAVAGTGVATLLGAVAAHALGWGWAASIWFGLTLSVASTVVLVRVLSERRELHTSSGHIAVGWLVVEDTFTVFLLVLLPTLVGTGSGGAAGIATSVAVTILKILALVAVAAVVGQRVIPRLLDRIAATRSRELFTLTVLAIALGLAVGSSRFFGVSMALGAFLAGMVVGRSDYSLRAATDAIPMRDAFAVLFFVSIGMLLNPRLLLQDPWLALAALGIVVLAKPLVAAGVLALLRLPPRTILSVPSALAQIGEFSFILGRLGRDVGVLPEAAMNIVVAVSITSIVLNPFVARLVAPAERWLLRHRRGVAALGDPGVSSSLQPSDRAIVVGYGPTGQTVARLLRDNGIAPTIVELNIDTVRALRHDGLSAIYGDARQPDTLVSAGLPHAGTLIVSGADTGSPEVIAQAREINPKALIFVRGAYLRDVAPLRQAGADEVFSGEGEVALAMTESVLRKLGATPDQIDRERRKVHDALGEGGPAPSL